MSVAALVVASRPSARPVKVVVGGCCPKGWVFEAWIWEYLSDEGDKSNSILQDVQVLQGKPPIARSTVSIDT